MTLSKKDNRYGIIATKSFSGGLAFIAYNYDETDDNLDATDELVIDVKGLMKKAKLKVSESSLDRRNNNTFRAWEKAGRPAVSKNVDISSLEVAAQLKLTDKYEIRTDDKGETQLKISLQRHSMKLIQLH